MRNGKYGRRKKNRMTAPTSYRKVEQEEDTRISLKTCLVVLIAHFTRLRLGAVVDMPARAVSSEEVEIVS